MFREELILVGYLRGWGIMLGNPILSNNALGNPILSNNALGNLKTLKVKCFFIFIFLYV